jgi:hypothetical protein
MKLKVGDNARTAPLIRWTGVLALILTPLLFAAGAYALGAIELVVGLVMVAYGIWLRSR